MTRNASGSRSASIVDDAENAERDLGQLSARAERQQEQVLALDRPARDRDDR
jgi:hypothetical protein